jgi:hypothetical protein
VQRMPEVFSLHSRLHVLVLQGNPRFVIPRMDEVNIMMFSPLEGIILKLYAIRETSDTRRWSPMVCATPVMRRSYQED